jgi:hypothetical protein
MTDLNEAQRLEEVKRFGHPGAPSHNCFTFRKFNGYHQPDICPVCFRDFPDQPWLDPWASDPAPAPVWWHTRNGEWGLL